MDKIRLQALRILMVLSEMPVGTSFTIPLENKEKWKLHIKRAEKEIFKSDGVTIKFQIKDIDGILRVERVK